MWISRHITSSRTGKNTCNTRISDGPGEKSQNQGHMMKHKINETESGLDISIDVKEGKKKKLLEAFQECQEGRCSCPTEEYKKLQSLEIKHNDENIELHLKSKDGLKLDKAEINKCLEYTEKRVNQENGQ